MLLTPHALVGAAIGATTDNIPLIIILALASHFILDSIPHADWGTWHGYKDFKLESKDYILLILDISLALILLWIVWDNSDRNKHILIGATFAVLVDLIDNVPFWKNYLRKLPFFCQLHKLHDRIHFRLKPKYWHWGVVTQVIIIIITLQFLIK